MKINAVNLINNDSKMKGMADTVDDVLVIKGIRLWK